MRIKYYNTSIWSLEKDYYNEIVKRIKEYIESEIHSTRDY